MSDAQDSESGRNDWEDENGFELEIERDNVPNVDVWRLRLFEKSFNFDESENNICRIIQKLKISCLPIFGFVIANSLFSLWVWK